MNIKELTEEIVIWANEVFPNRRPETAFLKMFSEIGELVADPSNADEYADVFIMLLDLANMHNINVERAIIDKMMINRKRTWRLTGAGVFQHIDNKIIMNEEETLAYCIGREDKKRGYQPNLNEDFNWDARTREAYNRGWHIGGEE